MATVTVATKGWRHIVGKVFVAVTIENQADVTLARAGFRDQATVRRADINEMLVDTGASHLFLSLDMIESLGLLEARVVAVETAAGPQTARVFEGARVTITAAGGETRTGTYEAIALPGGSEPLLGLTVMEGLGVTPDVVSHRLTFLPEQGRGTHITAYRA